jgi:hypothetical protein
MLNVEGSRLALFSHDRDETRSVTRDEWEQIATASQRTLLCQNPTLAGTGEGIA